MTTTPDLLHHLLCRAEHQLRAFETVASDTRSLVSELRASLASARQVVDTARAEEPAPLTPEPLTAVERRVLALVKLGNVDEAQRELARLEVPS